MFAHSCSLGSFRRGARTGIIFNNGMNDFATSENANYWDLAPSYANVIEPRKRPLSSMSPTFVLDEHDSVLVSVGGAGGTMISTSVANVSTWRMYGTCTCTYYEHSECMHQICFAYRW